MSSSPVAGGDAAAGDAVAAVSVKEDNHTINFTMDGRPRTAQRRMATPEAGKRQRSLCFSVLCTLLSFSAFMWYCFTAVSK